MNKPGVYKKGSSVPSINRVDRNYVDHISEKYVQVSKEWMEAQTHGWKVYWGVLPKTACKVDLKNIRNLEHTNYNYDGSIESEQYKACALKSVVDRDIGSYWIHINFHINNLRRIGAASSSGYAMIGDFTGKNDVVIKRAKVLNELNFLRKSGVPDAHYIKYSVMSELYIGMAIVNNLTPLMPNFIYTYGSYNCSKREGADGPCKDLKGPDDVPDIVIEAVNNAEVLDDYCRHCSLYQFESILLQVLCSMVYSYFTCMFSHNDLHSENILVTPLNTKCNLSYSVGDSGTSKVYKVINATHLAKIIDYGRCSAEITHNEKLFILSPIEKFGNNNIGELDQRVVRFPACDMYNLYTSLVIPLNSSTTVEKTDKLALIENLGNIAVSSLVKLRDDIISSSVSPKNAALSYLNRCVTLFSDEHFIVDERLNRLPYHSAIPTITTPEEPETLIDLYLRTREEGRSPNSDELPILQEQSLEVLALGRDIENYIKNGRKGVDNYTRLQSRITVMRDNLVIYKKLLLMFSEQARSTYMKQVEDLEKWMVYFENPSQKVPHNFTYGGLKRLDLVPL